jgi:urate oxidase/2-oxo-4-hydroxy-4-carboxy-5-ureidoimidazoline decarboxylase
MTEARISYGKLEVPVQRVLGDRLLACDVSLEVLGQGFLAAYTEGDNSAVVATDTMKNVILQRALAHDEPTLEGFLHGLGLDFLARYPEMEGLRLWAREQPWVAAPVGPDAVPSDRLFRLEGADHAVAELELSRDAADASVAIAALRSGHVALRLLKTTGSAFTKFARDDSTTLPERGDRPLFIFLDVHWRYTDAAAALGEQHVDPHAVRQLLLDTFHEFVSESIQHLVHEMGQRLLAAFPALAEVCFHAENHTSDPVPGMADAPPGRAAYTAAFPAWGLITLTLTR